MKGDIEISDTITDVDAKEWITLAGNHIESSHQWFETVEDSRTKKMRYVFVREGNTLVAAACSYPYIEKMYGVEMPLLEVKSPIGKMGAFFFRDSRYIPSLIRGLEEIQEKEKTRGILIADEREEEYQAVKDHLKGFSRLLAFEDTYIDLDFASFDDYLGSLSEEAWRSAKMTLNRAKRWKIRTLFTKEFSKWKETVCRLQRCTREYHKDERMYVPEAFYESLEKHMRENAELLLFLKEDISIASALALNTGEVAIYKLPGIDPSYRKYQAYFLIYYEGIRKAIERGQKRIYFGPTTYEFKEKIGCKKEPLYGFCKMRSPLFHFFLASYMRMCWYLDRKF